MINFLYIVFIAKKIFSLYRGKKKYVLTSKACHTVFAGLDQGRVHSIEAAIELGMQARLWSSKLM